MVTKDFLRPEYHTLTFLGCELQGCLGTWAQKGLDVACVSASIAIYIHIHDGNKDVS